LHYDVGDWPNETLEEQDEPSYIYANGFQSLVVIRGLAPVDAV